MHMNTISDCGAENPVPLWLPPAEHASLVFSFNENGKEEEEETIHVKKNNPNVFQR